MKTINTNMQVKLQHAIAKLAQNAALTDDDTYETKANAIITQFLQEHNIAVSEDNIYTVRLDFDYYSAQ
jgi:hypothetical protein